MSGHARGLYEVLITEALEARLRDLGDRLEVRRDGLRAAEAADRIALHLGRIVQRAIAALGDEERVTVGIALARKIIEVVGRWMFGPAVRCAERVALEGTAQRVG